MATWWASLIQLTSNLLPIESCLYPRLILGLRPANERRCYKVKLSFIGWTQAWNHPCFQYYMSMMMLSLANTSTILFPLVARQRNSWKTNSMPWLLMPWLQIFAGHQQWLYWLCRINGPWQRNLNICSTSMLRNNEECNNIPHKMWYEINYLSIPKLWPLKFVNG